MLQMSSRSDSAAGRIVMRTSGFKAHVVLTRPGQRFRNALDRSQHRPIAHVNGGLRRDPAIARHAEQASTLDHLAAGFRYGRGAELHSAGQSFAVPWGAGAAVVFSPNAQPWEIGAMPDITEGQLARRGERDEVGVLAVRVHQVSGESGG